MDSSKCITRILTQRSSLHSTCKIMRIKDHRYDFDKDGFVKKEDIRLVLSHIPIEKTILFKAKEEGAYTSQGGGR